MHVLANLRDVLHEIDVEGEGQVVQVQIVVVGQDYLPGFAVSLPDALGDVLDVELHTEPFKDRDVVENEF